MKEKLAPVKRAIIASGFVLAQAACQNIPSRIPTPTETCPPGTGFVEEANLYRWLRLDIGGIPFALPLNTDDPQNKDEQILISIVEIKPNEGVVIEAQYPEGRVSQAFVENNMEDALRFSSEIDFGLQFWACSNDEFGFFRLVPLQVPIPGNYS